MSLNSRIFEPPPYGSAAWQVWRRHGLGASEMAAVAGLDAYRGEYAVALSKRGLAEDSAESWPMTMGHLMEPHALDWYERTFGCELTRGETWGDARWPHCFATLDARVKDKHVGVEAKWSGRDWTEVPRHIHIQVQAQMALADLTAVDIVLVTPRTAPRLLATIERDDAEAYGICDLAEAWWVRYMTGDEMPPVDGSREASAWLDRQRGTDERDATEEQEALLYTLRDIRRTREAAEQDERRVINRLKASMAATGVLRARGARVTWSETKGDRKSVV